MRSDKAVGGGTLGDVVMDLHTSGSSLMIINALSQSHEVTLDMLEVMACRVICAHLNKKE